MPRGCANDGEPRGDCDSKDFEAQKSGPICRENHDSPRLDGHIRGVRRGWRVNSDFWLKRWETGQIGFHQAEVDAALQAHWATLNVPSGGSVFVPLCGKSRDFTWLRAQGHPVIGVELSEIAVRAFFAENGLMPDVSALGPLERHAAEGVTLLCGDFFDVKPNHLAGVAAVYDRAALIALPPDMRERYVERIIELIPHGAPILLVTLSYPDGEMEGPPFSVNEAEVRRLYGERFHVELVSTEDILADDPGFRQRGLTELTEQVYRMTPRAPDQKG